VCHGRLACSGAIWELAEHEFGDQGEGELVVTGLGLGGLSGDIDQELLECEFTRLGGAGGSAGVL